MQQKTKSKTGIAYRTETKAVINVGVNKLARECGVSENAIRYHLARGKDMEAIRRHYASGVKSTGGIGNTKAARTDQGQTGAPGDGRKDGKPRVPARFTAAATATGPEADGGGRHRAKPGTASVSDVSDDELIEEAEAAGGPEEQISNAQRRRVIALADAQEIANAIKRGEWVELKRVQMWGEGVVKNTIGLVMRVPGQLRDPIAAETDPVKCDEMMAGELKRVVEEIQKMEELWKAK